MIDPSKTAGAYRPRTDHERRRRGGPPAFRRLDPGAGYSGSGNQRSHAAKLGAGAANARGSCPRASPSGRTASSRSAGEPRRLSIVACSGLPRRRFSIPLLPRQRPSSSARYLAPARLDSTTSRRRTFDRTLRSPDRRRVAASGAWFRVVFRDELSLAQYRDPRTRCVNRRCGAGDLGKLAPQGRRCSNVYQKGGDFCLLTLRRLGWHGMPPGAERSAS